MKPADLELLVTRVMPFGKYQGRLIADLPGNYLNWFARAGFPPGEIGRLLALMQEINHNGLTPLLAPLRARRPAKPANDAPDITAQPAGPGAAGPPEPSPDPPG